jgi:adenylate cyclase
MPPEPQHGAQQEPLAISTPAAAPSPSSIAVLPFADLSPEHDQQYFSDGIAEEILNVLAHTDVLKVASRTSSFQYRDPKAGAPAIARALGVRHLLEGSVRKAGDRVRVTAQLIDAVADQHLWSEAYDRPLTAENAFAIQEDIANAVVQQLTATISVGAAASHVVKVEADTADIAAYELYLRGRALFVLRGGENLEAAAQALEEATRLDPRFARAWETLAMVYGVSESWGMAGRDYQRLALDAADRAQQLNPQLSTPYAVRGTVLYDRIALDGTDNWQASLANLDEAIARDSKNASAWFWRGLAFVTLGFFDRAMTDIAKCLEIDPAYGYCAKWLAYTHLLAGNDERAFALYERSGPATFSAAPVFAAAYAARGDRSAARAILVDFYADVPQIAAELDRVLTDHTYSDADRARALALMEKTPPADGRAVARFHLGDYSGIDSPNSINSLLWWYRGDQRYWRSAERKAHMRRFRLPDYWRAHGFPPQCRPVGAEDFDCR